LTDTRDLKPLILPTKYTILTLLIAVQACCHLSSPSSPGHGILEPFIVLFNSSICGQNPTPVLRISTLEDVTESEFHFLKKNHTLLNQKALKVVDSASSTCTNVSGFLKDYDS
jgi:hypothetical protein